MVGYWWERINYPNALFCSVIFSLGFATAIRWTMNRWSRQRYLHSRVVLLASIRQVVEEWEESCLREVEDLLTAEKRLSPELTGETYESLFNSAIENGEKGRNHVSPFYGTVRSMAFAPAVDLNCWLSYWCMGRYLCVSLAEDLLLVERLGYIIKYVAFRRLSLMAEARYYAAAWRRAVYGTCKHQPDVYLPKPHIPLWLVGRRPFWIVPLSNVEAGRFLCLPLSYFPVESIITCKAEETWIKKLVSVLPNMTSGINIMLNLPHEIRTRRTLQIVKSIVKWRFPKSWQKLWEEIDHLFFTHGVRLAKRQLEIRKESCQRFYYEKLIDNIVLVTGEGPDIEEVREKYPSRFISNNMKNIAGREVLYRDTSSSRKLSLLLRLRSLSHALRIGINLIAVQHDFFSEWMVFSALLSTNDRVGREKILANFSLHTIRGVFAAVFKALITSLDASIKDKIYVMLRDELVHELTVKVATSDEAFLQRCVEEGLCGGGNLIEQSFSFASNVASQILDHYDYKERKHMGYILVLLFSTCRKEIDVALFAFITALLDYHDIAQMINCCLGITVKRELNYEMTQFEEKPVPVEMRYGLRLLMDILAEEDEVEEEKIKMNLRPFLALIVCGGCFFLEWPIESESKDNTIPRKIKKIQSIEKLFNSVIKFDYYNYYSLIYNRSEKSFLQQKDRNSIIGSLKEDATYVKEFVFKKMMGFPENVVDKSLSWNLHQEEIDLLRHPKAMSYIPQSLSFEGVFDKKPRFILRQLGLETIFAYKAAMVLWQSGFRNIKDSLVDYVSSPFHNGFSQIFIQLMEFMEKILFYALLTYREKLPLISYLINFRLFGGRILNTNVDINNWNNILLWQNAIGYRVVLKDYEDYSFGPPFRLVQELTRYLPTTIHDASLDQYASSLVDRRMVWQRVIKEIGDIKFDEIGRIIGGFSLTKSIDFYQICFVYPQLHHSVKDGSLLLTLSDFTADFRAGEITALVGQTGSGKSTIMRLLKRMFDPVATVKLDEISNSMMWMNCEALVKIFRYCYLEHSLPLPNEENSANVIRLDGIPLSCFSTIYLRKTFAMLEQNACIFENMTFFENIFLFASDDSKREMAMSLAKVCRCESFIVAHPLSYDALAGRLSAGERQRLALARALAGGCGGSGLLLLDEPTSHLDGYNEGCVEEALSEFLGAREGATAIVISHRLSTLRLAGRVVVLEGGRSAYEGPLSGLGGRGGFASDPGPT
ncbi:ABC transporter-like [Trypanosoma melophagium]|uniref:ABC transporter-like n=1 Tax=Trypanosoma melophagium TaxID=715481 RepID=UPI003519EA9B|nr:ABC transporter-like [Trypanosoma melophagium]